MMSKDYVELTDQETIDLLTRAWAKQTEMLDLLEAAWGIIANSYGGDWDLASPQSGWKEAAERWRDEYHALLPEPSIEAGLVEVEHA